MCTNSPQVYDNKGLTLLLTGKYILIPQWGINSQFIIKRKMTIIGKDV
jgi:hypothetical protein